MRVEIGSRHDQTLWLRRILVITGFIGGIVFSVGVTHSTLFLGAAALLVFLGATNFGRQCPLFLAFRRLRNRSKT